MFFYICCSFDHYNSKDYKSLISFPGIIFLFEGLCSIKRFTLLCIHDIRTIFIGAPASLHKSRSNKKDVRNQPQDTDKPDRPHQKERRRSRRKDSMETEFDDKKAGKPRNQVKQNEWALSIHSVTKEVLLPILHCCTLN